MSELVAINREVERIRTSVDAILARINETDSVAEVTETRARTDALRAWAKAHKRIEEVRVELMRVEIHALARLVELGGEGELHNAYRGAAKWFASLDAEARDAVAEQYASSTTALGVARAAWAAQQRAANVAAGWRYAQSPRVYTSDSTEPEIPYEGAPEESRVSLAAERSVHTAAALSNILDGYTSDGEPFTVEQVTEELIEEAGIGFTDPAVMEGVREAVRSAIRRAPRFEIGGYTLPRTITARAGDEEEYIRVPVQNAAVAHLDDNIALREEALRQDSKRLDHLLQIRAALGKVPGCRPESRIVDLLAEASELAA